MRERGDTKERREAYTALPRDPVRETFERELFAEVLPALIEEAGGGRVLDLGCGDGLAATLAGKGLESYAGVDLCPPPSLPGGGLSLAHDLREGLGPVEPEPFDVYFGSFGVASHLSPEELTRLVGDVAAHARPGSIVALEGLGLHSLEWPRLWDTRPGPERTLAYRLGRDVDVHPWSPEELFGIFEAAGIEPLRALDRSVQAGPKAGEDGYWPGLPALRAGLNLLLMGDRSGREPLEASLPPLPGHPASAFHHRLAADRRAVLARANGAKPEELARAVWDLEPRSAGGFGHGLLVVGRAL